MTSLNKAREWGRACLLSAAGSPEDDYGGILEEEIQRLEDINRCLLDAVKVLSSLIAAQLSQLDGRVEGAQALARAAIAKAEKSNP